MVGQDAVATAEAFRDGVGITGVVLSKLDGDARGGAALSVREVTGQPILFASTGEKLEDFDVFHPDRMASRILGMGDVLTLIEQAEAAFDEEQKERMTAKLHRRRVLHAGGLPRADDRAAPDGPDRQHAGDDAGHGPDQGPAGRGRRQALRQDHRDHPVDDARASGANPKIINGSRRARIANGSGVTVMDVNQLLNRFAEAQKMMKQMGGMMGLPGGRRKATKSPEEQAQGHEGRPAGRAGVPRRAARRPARMPAMPPG